MLGHYQLKEIISRWNPGGTMKNLSQYAQYAFLALFVLSVLAGFNLLKRSQEALILKAEQSGDQGITKGDVEDQLRESAPSVTTTYVTMALTLAGFIVSTVMNVRKERRESKEAELNIRKMELELEKMRMELDAMKKA